MGNAGIIPAKSGVIFVNNLGVNAMGGQGSGARKQKKKGRPPLPVGTPPCPKYLDTTGKREWRRLVKMLDRVTDLMSEVDWDTVGLLADTWSRYYQASDLVKSEGFTVVTDSGVERIHPAYKVITDSMHSIRQYQTALGMTPKARRQIYGEEIADNKPNPLTEYLAKRRVDLGSN